MQNPSVYSPIKPQPQPQYPDQEHLNCPRCDSANTKFCYYNNYNLSQPRHFCKNCKRYWTKGGALRNIPVGGSSRKNSKRSSSVAASSNNHQNKRLAASAPEPDTNRPTAEPIPLKGEDYVGQFGNFPGGAGNFSSLLISAGGQFGNFDAAPGTADERRSPFECPNPGSGRNLGPRVGLESGSSNNEDEFLNIEGCGSVWPDLAMYTPKSNYQ